MDEDDERELLWWRRQFATRVVPQSEYIPKPNDVMVGTHLLILKYDGINDFVVTRVPKDN